MNHPRRQLPPGASNKRKERESFDFLKPSKIAKPSFARAASGKPATSKTLESASNNQLLAGYLAHEFLTKGTLFGQPWDPARTEAVPVSADLRRMKPLPPSNSSSHRTKAVEPPPPQPSGVKKASQVEKKQRYMEVANLLKSDGAQLPGIVNPTQLARFLDQH